MSGNKRTKSAATVKVAMGACCAVWLTACGGGGGGGDSSPPPSSGGGGGGATNVTISGQASGISAGQLDISNSGADEKSLINDGSFSFTVPSGGSYDILVEKNPLEQICTVNNASGSNVTGNVNNVTVSCVPVSQVTSCSGLTDSDDDTLSDCDELTLHSTNPWLADTDGDSYDDGREVTDFDPNNNRYHFNPRVADMAKISVELTSVPEVDLAFSQGTSGSRNVSTSYETSESNSISNTWGGEISRQLEVGHTLSLETTQTVGAEVSASLTDVGVTGSYESSLSVGFESSVSQTRGSSVNWSDSATAENTRAYGETVSLVEEQNSTYTNGFLRVTARVVNDGRIPYDLENLTLSAVLFDPKRPFDIESIGTMEFSSGGFPLTTVLPGESAPLNFSTELTLGKAQTLLRDSENIVVTPGTYRLLDIDNQSLLLIDRDVAVRTATVIINYGIDVAREDKFRVAINQGNGSRSVTIREALQDILGLSVDAGTGSWVFGNDSSASATNTGLLAVGNYAMSADDNRYWLVAHDHNVDNTSGDRVTDYYNLLLDPYSIDDIQLRAGDKLSLVYVGDDDRDGLGDRMERELGTLIDVLDTDGDTLGDGLEVYGWLTNLMAPPCDQGDSLVRVYSNPLIMDSDADGNDDAAEYSACENPSFNFVARAGDNQFVHRGDLVTLSGGIEGIATGTPDYRWALISGPDVVDEFGDTTRELMGRQPMFEAPDEVTTLVWELSATLDGETQTDRTHTQVQLNRSEAIYVGAPAVGKTADGSIDAPYASLNEALANIDSGDDLYVMSQSGYTLVNTFSVPAGTSIFGGYDQDWVRDVESNKTSLTFTTNLEQPAVQFTDVSEPTYFSGFSVYADGRSGNAGNDVVALDVLADPVSSSTLYIRNNSIQASDVATGTNSSPGSSYGLRVNGLSALRLFGNSIIAGRGGNGTAGTNGAIGAGGNDAGGQGGASGRPGENGGRGGDGGGGPAGSGDRGVDGTDFNASIQGGAGGSGAGGCSNATDAGNRGDNGAPGAHGGGASQPAYANFILGYEISRGGNGANGTDAAGGGGGGGGGGCGFAGGGAGGGGGEGGAGGGAGTGGYSAGASIAVWLNAVNNVEARENTIRAFAGGSAGRGGNGVRGGFGGDGASGRAGGVFGVCPLCDRGGAGSSGGDGGDGGRGGNGGGGAGGASFGIFVAPDLSPILIGNDIASGNAGTGGTSSTNGGRGGDSFAVFDADTSDGATPVLTDNTLTPGLPGNGGGIGGAAGTAGDVNF